MTGVTRRSLLGWLSFASSASLCTQFPSTLKEEVESKVHLDWHDWVNSYGMLEEEFLAEAQVITHRDMFSQGFSYVPALIEHTFEIVAPFESDVGIKLREAYYSNEPMEFERDNGLSFKAVGQCLSLESWLPSGNAHLAGEIEPIPAIRCMMRCFDVSWVE